MSNRPQHDPTELLDVFRYAQLSNLLVAAVVEFDVGRVLADGPLPFNDLCSRLGLQERPANVLLTALRSLSLIDLTETHSVTLTPYGREKLDPSSDYHLRGYIGLGGLSADVQNMIACLKNDAPAGDVSFVYHEGQASALDDAATADLLTRAMADRARNVAPALADAIDLSNAGHLVDVGGAHGLYSIPFLQKWSQLRATILDREPPLRVAAEYAQVAGVSDRVTLLFDDAHTAVLEDTPNVVLLANLLHDYDTNTAAKLVRHYADQLPSGGRLMVLDSLLDSVPPGAPPISKGPREVAAYSALLFSICEGRCYRRDEIESWMQSAGLTVEAEAPTVPAHGTVVIGRRP